MEGENPTRRYKWFRPRQAYAGAIKPVDPANNGLSGIYNNSTGQQVLVVRDVEIAGGNGDFISVFFRDGLVGTVGGSVSPLIPKEGAGPGQMVSADLTATDDTSANLFMLNSQWRWIHDFPFRVILPNTTLCFYDQAATNHVILSAVWEALSPDELDFLDW